MGYRSYEKSAGRYAAKRFAPKTSTANYISPYDTRTIRAGSRQEDWQDILTHGEHSDTDWDKVMRENTQNMRRAYAPRGDWAKRGDMDKTSQLLYDATVGHGVALRKYTPRLIRGQGMDRENISVSKYQSDKANWERVEGGGRDGAESGYRVKTGDRDGAGRFYSDTEVSSYDRQIARNQAEVAKATNERDVKMAKWMAEYNKNLNIHENIAISERRAKYRERFGQKSGRHEAH
jgi:hypothetical protein